MPGMMGRFTTIFKAKMSTAMDKAENPNETLDYSYEKQLGQLQQVRRGIADVATSKARLQQQVTTLNEQTSKLDSQAQQALTVNREDLARTALARKGTLAAQLQGLTSQLSALQVQQDKMVDGESRLASKIEAFRSQKETMKAQYSAAQATVKINEAATGLSEEMGDVQLAMERAQGKIQNMQARATALDELADSGTDFTSIGSGSDDIDRQLAQLSSGADVEAQLAAMKKNVLGSGSSSSDEEEPVQTVFDPATGTHIPRPAGQ